MHSRNYCGRCLWICTILMLGNINVCRGQNDGIQISRTFLGSGSYAEFPQWLTTTEGLAHFSFITSAPSGLLFYIDSTGTSGDYLLLQLQSGSVTVEVRVGGNVPSSTQETHRETLGEHLNDNLLHNIRIVHANSRFSFTLDGSIDRDILYSLDLNFDTRGSVYFGGIPESYAPDAQFDTSSIFIGCLQDIQFANNSFFPFSVMRKQPLDENNLRSRCVDPCANISCNGGVCVSQWPTEETAFCDCRDTNRAGPTCSDAPTAHQLMNGDVRTYSCYSLPPDQPFTDEPNNAVMQLAPPIPTSGTLMTGLGFSQDNARGFFAIFIKDSKVFLQLNNMTEIEVSPTLTQTFRYRISYLQMPTHVVININRVSAANVLTLVDERNITLSLQRYDFRDICIGGVLLEVANYVGTLEYVFFRRYPLAEQESFIRFGREIISSSNVIRFVGNVSKPSLAFERYGLGSQKISFEFRVKPEDASSGGGLLLYSENEYSFGLSLFNGDLLIVIVNTLDLTFEPIYSTCNITGLSNGSWYEVVLETLFGSGNETIRLRLTVNDYWICDISDADLEEIIQSLAASPLEFGTTESFFSLGDGVPFIGCMQNIVFGVGTESFSPNLEAIANVEQRFEINGCYFCTEEEGEMLSCENGGSCSNLGVQQLQCDCPDNFTGLSCEEPLFPTSEPLPTASLTSTAPSPTSTTPMPSIVNASNPGTDIGEIGMWVGIALGITFGAVLVLLTSTCLYIFCCGRIQKEGFYKTHENQSSQVSLPRYSASLQRVSSQNVSLERNGIVRNHNHVSTEQEADQDKEFFI